MKSLIYLRVSKKELNEKTQLPVILKNFNLKEREVIILQEKISGYKEELQEKRTEMKKVLDMIEKKQITDIYVYSLERIYRNIYWLLEFYFKCQKYGIEIHSHLQPEITKINGDKPIDIFLKLISVLTSGFMGMQESYLISERTKKSFVTDEKGNKVSYKGNKLGRKTDLEEGDIDIIIKESKTKSYREIKALFEQQNKKISIGTISKILNQ